MLCLSDLRSTSGYLLPIGGVVIEFFPIDESLFLCQLIIFIQFVIFLRHNSSMSLPCIASLHSHEERLVFDLTNCHLIRLTTTSIKESVLVFLNYLVDCLRYPFLIRVMDDLQSLIFELLLLKLPQIVTDSVAAEELTKLFQEV